MQPAPGTNLHSAINPAAAAAVAALSLLQNLVKLNFNQEAREADMRYSLVRVRENVESIAFYGGESSEMAQIMQV